MSDVLSSPIQFIKGVGPKLAKVLSRKGIETIEDALYFIPRAYEDRRHITPIKNLRPNQTATLFGKIQSSREIRAGRRRRFEAILNDGTGSIALTWFHAFPGIQEEFQVGTELIVYGDVKYFHQMPQIAHPEYEKVEKGEAGKPKASINFGRVVPIYSETEGLHQKTLRKMMGEVLKTSLSELTEPLPESLRTRLGLPTLRKSFVSIHFPDQCPEEGTPSEAVQRVIFEEFFVLQLGLGLRKQKQKKETAPVITDKDGIQKKFYATLPFSLTNDQENTLKEILSDLKSGKAMTRLVQGDVGSGKTVVALLAAAVAKGSGYQTALMAPTEILAQQHLKTAERFLKPLGIECLLVSHANSSKKEVREKIKSGKAHVVIGTHAIFQEGIEFQKLGLAIVDEQHRFGVEQRGELIRKAGKKETPHLLMMTATPIPRTLAFTLYGDLDLSLIREKPPGRTPVKTRILWDRERPKLYQKIRERVLKGEQVYVIYPLIEASEKLELKSATDMHKKLQSEVFPEFSLAMLHGRMKPEEKDKILTEFKEKKWQVLISTTVIEVGIDVPNATLMVIEHPERLGLSQLHQLRGRVGRGSLTSECILVADKFVTQRLKVMERTEDGFEIAEEDLKIRGPGEFLGTRQSGLPGFRVGHILRDASLLAKAREEAEKILETDPQLSSPENASLRKMVESRWKAKIERLRGA